MGRNQTRTSESASIYNQQSIFSVTWVSFPSWGTALRWPSRQASQAKGRRLTKPDRTLLPQMRQRGNDFVTQCRGLQMSQMIHSGHLVKDRLAASLWRSSSRKEGWIKGHGTSKRFWKSQLPTLWKSKTNNVCWNQCLPKTMCFTRHGNDS